MDLDKLLRPRSVAVVGASEDTSKYGGKVAANIAASTVQARSFVNARSAGSQLYATTVVGSLDDLDAAPDCVLLAVPSAAVVGELERAGRLGVGAAVVFAAGFAESGALGGVAQSDLIETARRHGIALLGPNCIGLMNLRDRVFATSVDSAKDARGTGATVLIAQSGSLGIVVSSREAGRFRYVLTTGNEALVTVGQLLDHLLDTDDEIESIALLMEAVRDRQVFADAVAKATRRGKRVVLLKLAVRGSAGRLAALHTGAVTGDRAPLEAFCTQHEVRLARDLRDFTAAVELMTTTTYRGGRRVGVFTSSGGTAVLAAARAEVDGLELPEPGPEHRPLIAQSLGLDSDRVTNPLDTTGFAASDSVRFEAALGEFALAGYDLVVVPLGGAGAADALERVRSVRRVEAEVATPIVPVWQHRRLLEEPGFVELYEGGGALFTDYESVLAGARLLAGTEERSIRAIDEQAATGSIDHPSAMPVDLAELLADIAAAGVPTALSRVVAHDAGSDDVLAELGRPIALKVSHRELVHKSDAGMVVYPIDTAADLDRNRADLLERSRAAGLTGATLVAQASVADGVELLCGFAHDVEVGAYATIAAGGIYTELFDDSATVLIDGSDELTAAVRRAIDRLRIAPVLHGARGRTPYDVDAAVATVVAAAHYFVKAPGLTALEVNPLVVRRVGAVAVDARAV